MGRQLYKKRVSGFLDPRKTSPTAMTLKPDATMTGTLPRLQI